MGGEQDALLAAVIRASLDCIVVIDEDGCVIEWNPAAETTFGYVREEAIGHPIADLIIPDHHRDAHHQGLARYLAGGSPRVLGRRVEVEGRRKDGSLIPVELAITEVRSGGKRLFTASLRDLSESRAAADELRIVQNRLSAFFDNVPAAIFIKSIDGRFELANPSAGEMWGRDPASLVGEMSYDLIRPEDAERARALDQKVIATGQPQIFEQRYRSARRESHAITARFPIRDASGEITHIGAVLIDIGERVRMEQELRESRAQLEAFFSHAPAGMFIKSLDGHYELVNDFAASMFGVPAADMVGKTASEVLSADSAAEAERIDQEVAATGEPQVQEQVYQNANGTTHTITARFPLRDHDGQVAKVGVVLLDTSAQREAEEELERSRRALVQSEKLTALGSLLAGVSHELNNPLAVAVGESILMQDEAEGTQFARRAERIRRSTERCSRIVQTFLAMARQKTPDRLRLEVNQLVEAALELTEYQMRGHGIEVRRELSSDLPSILADSDLLHQVLVNLLLNAQQSLEHAAGERVITVRTGTEGDRSLASITVADSGAGIAPEIVRHIFDPFFTTKPQGSGTGIGLSFSQGVIEAHGGTLRLDASEVGASFTICLPVGESSSAADADDEAGLRLEGAGRVLIVDDEPDFAEMLAEFVGREGYTATIAGDGEEAMALIGRERFDIILSDFRMPRADGPAFHAWIARNRPELIGRLGFVTGDTLSESAAAFLRESGRPAIEKPFSPQVLRELLRSLGGA